MSKIGLWHVGATRPQRLPEATLDLEKTLESWLEETPGLIQSDLVIVGRQIRTDAGVLDLLGIDPQGRWTIVEVERGASSRDAIAQAIDYASLIASLDSEKLRKITNEYLVQRGTSIESILDSRDSLDSLALQDRELSLVIVGTTRAVGLDRMVQYLANQFGVPISVVTLSVHQLPDGSKMLSREVHEAEHTADAVQRRTQITPKDVVALAHQSESTGTSFEAIYNAAISHNLYPRTWKTSRMYASPKNRTQMLFTAWAKPSGGKLRVCVGHQSFNEFYNVSVQEVAQCLG